MSTVNPCPVGGMATSSSDCIAGGGQCMYPAIGVVGDVCCCQFPSPSPVGYVYANVQIFTNNVPSSVANQVGWQINISPSSCGSPVSGTGPQSGLKINIDNCTQVTLTIQATSVPSGVSCTPLTVSATVNAGQTAYLGLSCSPTPSPTPQQYWTLNVNINDPYNAGYIITDNYGNSLQATTTQTTSFANYPSNVSSVTLNAQIQFNPPNMQCSITPSTVTVNAPSGGTGTVTQSFTVACATAPSPSPSPSPSPTVPSAPSIPLSWTDIAIILAVLAASGIAGYGIAQAVKQK